MFIAGTGQSKKSAKQIAGQCFILLIITCLPFLLKAQPVGANMSNPVIIGNYSQGSYTYTDTKNNTTSNGYLNDIGNASDDIYYRITVQGTTTLNISLCSATFDTYLHLLSSTGTGIAVNDDNGPLCIGLKSSIQTTVAPGTYYIVTEGYGTNAGSLPISVNSVVQAPPLPPDTRNFIRVWDATAPETNPNTLMTRAATDVKQSTQYFDGLGRPEQTVIKKGSLSGGVYGDLVSPIVYDSYGREVQKYLPYVATTVDGLFKANPLTDQNTFYSGASSPIAGQGETFFYGKTDFEPSPLNRPLKTYAPGNSWVGALRGTEAKYWINTINDAVRIWNVTIGATGSFSTYISSGTYQAGQLYKNISVDENNKQVIEFKDKEGKIILKKVQLTALADDGTGRNHDDWMCTYYLYDDLGNLRCVIQPEGVKAIKTNWLLNNTTILAEQCFRYEYDQRNRMIVKKVPGAGEVYMVYDARDRLVMTQDANLRTIGKWMVTKYENGLNRPIETGLWTNANTFASHRTTAELSTSYPTISGTYEELTKTFYDDYTWLSSNGNPLTDALDNYYTGYVLPVSNSTWPYPENVMKSSLTKGMVTGTKVKALNTGTYLYSINFYDDKGRAVQVKSKNLTNGTDISTTQYSFSGIPVASVSKTDNGGTGLNFITVITKPEYDDLFRVSGIKKQVVSTINGISVNKAEQLISTNSYDKLGQLSNKVIAPAYNGSGLENLVFEYNIRGWLLGINRAYLINSGQSGASRFGFELGYDKLTNKTGQNFVSAKFNGNISGVVWKSDGDDVRRKYDFGYDEANRLLKADFVQDNGGSTWNNTMMNYSMQMGDGFTASSAYDDNGNIKKMIQYGWMLGGSTTTPIDNLTYNYTPGTNRLLNVSDANNLPDTKLGDFRTSTLHTQTKTATTVDYTYDANGNLLKDLNKDIGKSTIDGIAYNYLNLPQTVTVYKAAGLEKGTITYTYDATGNKLQKKVVEGTSQTITTYLNGAVFESKGTTTVPGPDVLQFIPQEEARIRFSPAVGAVAAKFDYDYMLKDHLGNVRMVLTDEQQTSIYPAATLENNNTPATDPLKIEMDFYTINTANIKPKSIATGIAAYQNHNGNPSTGNSNPIPLNNNPNCTATTTIKFTDLSDKLYQINGNDSKKTGLDITLKVMSGDKINILGKSYYMTNTVSPTSPNLPVNDLILALLGTPASPAAGKALPADLIANTSGLGNPVGSFIGVGGSSTPASKPRAFISYILLDEQFNFVSGYSSPVGANAAVKSHFDEDVMLQNIAVKKNGYLYVFCSNESPVNVYFDNLQVTQTKGPILEETHYYPFGLTMTGISSKAAGKLGNKYKYNGKELQSNEFSDGTGLELYDYGARLQDPQLGRWWVQDKFADVYVALTPYHYAANNPIKIIDEAGHILHDTKGNIIATSNGTTSTSSSFDGSLGGKRVSITYKSEDITIYTDKGTPIHAQRAVEAYVTELNEDGTAKGPAVTKPASEFSGLNSNCYGYALAGGNVWIRDGESIEQLIADEYTELPEGQKGKFSVIYWNSSKGKDPVHAAKNNADGTYDQDDAENKVNTKAGEGKFWGENRKDPLQNPTVSQYNRKDGDHKIYTGAYKSLPKVSFNGVNIVDKKEIEKILKNLGLQ